MCVPCSRRLRHARWASTADFEIVGNFDVQPMRTSLTRASWLPRIVCVGLVAATGCGGSESHMPETPLPEVKSISPAGHARPLGRTERLADGSLHYAWSGAGFELRFIGRKLSILLEDSGNWHTLDVDGLVRDPLITAQGRHEYQVVDEADSREHIVRLTRRTEALFGPTRLLELRVSGVMLKPAGARKTHLEFVGDSITAGYGNLGSDPSCKFGPETENYEEAYPALVARALDAEATTVAWSGRGIVRNYADEPGDTMPDLYERTLPETKDSRWNGAQAADVVVVNLGTNDFSTKPHPELSTFAHAYAQLLARIRARNPEAYILCLLGPLLAGEGKIRAREGIERALETRRRAGDGRVEMLLLKTPNVNPGCDYHPSRATHASIAAEVVMALRPQFPASQ